MRHRRPQPRQPVLEQVIGGTLPEAFDRRLIAEGTRDHDEGDVQPALLQAVQGLQGVELGEMIIGEDDAEGRFEVGEVVGLGFHSTPVGLEAGAAEFVHDQQCVGEPVFEDEDAKRLSHRRLLPEHSRVGGQDLIAQFCPRLM